MMASSDGTQPLPLLFRLTAGVRRLAGDRGATASRAPIARPLRRVLSAKAPKGARFVAVCGGELRGMQMLVDLATEKYYWLGTHERRVQELLAREIAPGDVAYDVGAHIGFFSLLMARCCGADGTVHAFEPLPANAHRLREGVAVNDLTNIVVHELALGDADGEARFTPGSTSLEGRLSGTGNDYVAIATVDSLVANGYAPPTFIKIDVEGAEASVLRGASATIAAHKPRLLIEIHSDEAGVAVVDALNAAYTYTDLATGRDVTPPLFGGHYYARPLGTQSAVMPQGDS